MSKESNNVKIVRAFQKATSSMYQSLENGMRKILDYGVEQAFAAHDARHQAHLQMGDSYGWILFKDANEVDRRVWWEGKEGSARANEALDKIAAHKFSTMGYVGYVVAGMSDGTYFSYKAELGFLHQSAGSIKTMNFDNIFTKA